MSLDRVFDILVIGGGINGTGIALDAAGRGLDVALAEQGDLAGKTSWVSSKMIHGGLRYLEHYEFRLVREALAEREVLQAKAPHLIQPLRLLLPHTAQARPAWMIRLGLFLYDHLSRRRSLPGCETIDLNLHQAGAVLAPTIKRAFAYSDCKVDDSRLVIANAMGAQKLGAQILPRHQVVDAQRIYGQWQATLRNAETGETSNIRANVLVNAAGPGAEMFLNSAVPNSSKNRVRLVKGSHIVIPKIYDGPEAFILQNTDDRVVFVIPFEEIFSLIGTTDISVNSESEGAEITPEETEYLCQAVNAYMRKPIGADDVVWSFAGARPLFDDGKSDPAAVTRDYVIELNAPDGTAPLLSIFGGKITTYRRLAEAALAKLAPYLPTKGRPWTAAASLPGGDIENMDVAAFLTTLEHDFPGIAPHLLAPLASRHGTQVREVLGDAKVTADLGRHFGAGLTAREVDYMLNNEWALSADDVLWRRSKSGLRMNENEQRVLAEFIVGQSRDAA